MVREVGWSLVVLVLGASPGWSANTAESGDNNTIQCGGKRIPVPTVHYERGTCTASCTVTDVHRVGGLCEYNGWVRFDPPTEADGFLACDPGWTAETEKICPQPRCSGAGLFDPEPDGSCSAARAVAECESSEAGSPHSYVVRCTSPWPDAPVVDLEEWLLAEPVE